MRLGWFAGFKHFFPNGNMLIFFDESYAWIGKGGNFMQLSHGTSV